MALRTAFTAVVVVAASALFATVASAAPLLYPFN